LAADLPAEARLLDLNISQACEQAPVSAIAAIRARHWLAGNREAPDSSGLDVEANGLSLADFRNF
jgi:antitoxin CcdA